MHIKRDISNWNIKIILSAGNPELAFACGVQQFKFRVRPIRTPRSFLLKTTLSEKV